VCVGGGGKYAVQSYTHTRTHTHTHTHIHTQLDVVETLEEDTCHMRRKLVN
jgi:hypothetical protein